MFKKYGALGAIHALLAVVLGAFAAHGLQDRMTEHHTHNAVAAVENGIDRQHHAVVQDLLPSNTSRRVANVNGAAPVWQRAASASMARPSGAPLFREKQHPWATTAPNSTALAPENRDGFHVVVEELVDGRDTFQRVAAVEEDARVARQRARIGQDTQIATGTAERASCRAWASAPSSESATASKPASSFGERGMRKRSRTLASMGLSPPGVPGGRGRARRALPRRRRARARARARQGERERADAAEEVGDALGLARRRRPTSRTVSGFRFGRGLHEGPRRRLDAGAPMTSAGRARSTMVSPSTQMRAMPWVCREARQLGGGPCVEARRRCRRRSHRGQRAWQYREADFSARKLGRDRAQPASRDTMAGCNTGHSSSANSAWLRRR